jgi:hypothetical protein
MIVVVDANNRNHPSQVLFNGEVAEPFGEEDGQVYYLTPHGTRIQFDQNLLYPNGGAQSSEDNGVSEISLLPPGVEMALKRLPGFSLDSGLNQPTSTADVNGLGSVPLGKGDNALTQPMTGGVCPNTQAAAGAQCAYVPGVPLGAGGERSYAVGGGFQPPAGADRDSGVMASSGLTAAQMQQVGEDLEKGTWLALGAATIYAILNAPMSLAQSYASFSLGTNRMFGQQDEYIQ